MFVLFTDINGGTVYVRADKVAMVRGHASAFQSVVTFDGSPAAIFVRGEPAAVVGVLSEAVLAEREGDIEQPTDARFLAASAPPPPPPEQFVVRHAQFGYLHEFYGEHGGRSVFTRAVSDAKKFPEEEAKRLALTWGVGTAFAEKATRQENPA